MTPRALSCLAALVLAFAPNLASCASPDKPRVPAEVAASLDRAEELFVQGETQRALDIARSAREISGMDPALRDRVERLTETFAQRRIEELSRQVEDPGDLEDLLELNLPRQLAVTAGINAARVHVDNDDPKAAYNLIQELDKRFPNHHERVAAGDILAEAGFAMANTQRRTMGIFSRRHKAIGPLEYLVLNYPSNPRCDEAYFTLGNIYEERKKLENARERYQDLVLYHPESPFVPRSEAAVPHIRLQQIRSPEFDRPELVMAREELERWLAKYPDNDLEESVRIDYADCLQRLARSDLSIARFYKRIDRPFGARWHGQRAFEEARLSGDEDLLERAKSFLERVPEVDELPATPAPTAAPDDPPTEGAP